MRKFYMVPLADGENPRKHKLGRGSDLIAEGTVQPTAQQRCWLVWPAGRWSGLFGKQYVGVSAEGQVVSNQQCGPAVATLYDSLDHM